jgi:hypothetical protein
LRPNSAALLPLLLVAACGGGSKSAAVGTIVTPSPTPAAKTCAAVLIAGTPVVKADIANGCTDPVNNTLVVSGSFACKGGGELFQYDYSGGSFWGLVGKAWRKSPGKAAEDPAYSAAYGACNG